MSAPLIWIIIPFVFAVAAFFLQNWPRLTTILTATFSLLLALLAWQFPLGQAGRLGPWTVEINTTLVILGRQLALIDAERTFLILLYGFGGLWIFAARVAKAPRHFPALGLAVIILSVAAIAVEPFLYAAPIIELAVLISLAMLIKPGKPVGRGILRYIIFQTLAMPCILFAGWAASGVEANPSDQVLLMTAAAMLGMGFAFWLAVFPFHTWVPHLTDEAHPYVAGFMLTFLPATVFMLALKFLDGFGWLRELPALPQALQITGVVMVATGGLWALFQTSLPRLLGYAVIMDSGFSLIALSLGNEIGLQTFAAAFIPRMATIGLWSLVLSQARANGLELTFSGMRGQMYRYPVLIAGLVTSVFCMAGLPLLAISPLRQAILLGLVEQSLPAVIWTLVGMAGLLISGFRLLADLVRAEEPGWQIKEKLPDGLLILGGIMLLVVLGIFPRIGFDSVLNLLAGFTHLP